jgi:hypothetical protein
LPPPLKRLNGRMDVLELRVAVGVILPFLRLAVALQTVPVRPQQTPHGPWTDGVLVPGQLVRQLGRALARPAQGGLRISPSHRIDQPLQGGGQRRVNHGGTLAPRAGLSQPGRTGGLGIRFSGPQLRKPSGDRVGRQARRTAHRAEPAPAIRLCFRRRPLTTHPFVHQPSQGSISRFNPFKGSCILHHCLIPETNNIVKLF